MDFTLEELKTYIQENYPSMTLVDTEDYENTMTEYENLNEKIYELQFEINEKEKEIAALSDKIQKSEAAYNKLKDGSTDVSGLLKMFLHGDIIVTDTHVYDASNKEISVLDDKRKPNMDNLSDRPGIYNYRRPNWFLDPKVELSPENVRKKTKKNTEGFLGGRLFSLKQVNKVFKNHGIVVNDTISAADKERKKRVVDLLVSDCSNEEKYIKYMLLSPGISHDFIDILDQASELGLSANVVIELLEQPKGYFNKEIIQAYVSKVHKATEYNLKLELAKELMRGSWYITADIKGKTEKFELVPYSRIKEIYESLSSIYDHLTNPSAVDVCVKSAQTSTEENEKADNTTTADSNNDDVIAPAITEDINESKENISDADSVPEFVNIPDFSDFDDSMLN